MDTNPVAAEVLRKILAQFRSVEGRLYTVTLERCFRADKLFRGTPRMVARENLGAASGIAARGCCAYFEQVPATAA